MSRAGVTHFYQTETDFTSLDQWEREYFLFTKMMEIPFFRRFRMWKVSSGRGDARGGLGSFVR